MTFDRLQRYSTLVLGLVVLYLTCVSVPAFAQSTFAVKAPKPGFGAIYIGRPVRLHPSIFPVPIEINGRAMTTVGRGQYTRVEVRPGRHIISVPNNFWTRGISGNPHPVALDVKAGASYYLLPTRWMTNERPSIAMINGIAIPTRTADRQESFSVKSGTAPAEFSGLTYTAASN